MRLIKAATVLVLLSACGGGGGGNDDELQLRFAAPDTSTTFSSVGPTVRVTTDDDGSINQIIIGDNTFSGDAVSDDNADTDLEDIVEMLRAVSAGEVTQDFALDNGTLNNAAFGLVADDESIDEFAFGTPTTLQDIPTSGQAIFSGRTIGAGTDAGGAQFAFTGDVQILANFATGAVTAGLSDFETQAVEIGAAAPGIPDLSGSGFLTDRNYTVALESEDRIGGIPEWFGAADGRLFGPAGSETAGTWAAESNVDNIAVEGSFGATQ